MLPIKLLTVLRSAGKDRATLAGYGLLNMLGSATAFIGAAGVVLFFRVLGSFSMWGSQMQNPYFLVGMIIFLTPFCLSSLGLLNISWSFTQNLVNVQMSGKSGAFIDGALTALIASPCCGPALAAAIGASFALPYAFVVVAFAFMGAGLSLPYVTLCAFPSLLKKIPRGGRWMIWVEHAGGVGILGLILWLASLLIENLTAVL